jgi:hypothetical protein
MDCRSSPSSRQPVFVPRRVSRNAIAAKSNSQSGSSISNINKSPSSELIGAA